MARGNLVNGLCNGQTDENGCRLVGRESTRGTGKVNSRLPSPRAMLAGKENPSSGWDEGRRDAMFGFYSGPYLPGPRSTRGLATLTLISFPARE